MNRNAPWIALALSTAAALALVLACDGCDGTDFSTAGTTSTATTTPTTSGGECSPDQWRSCGTGGSGGSGGAGGSGGSGDHDVLLGCAPPPNRCSGFQVCGASGEWSGCLNMDTPSSDPCDPFDCDGLDTLERTACLVEGPLVRYFIDEAAYGIPATLVDSAPSGGGYDLAIFDAPPPLDPHFHYFEQMGQRGVLWSKNGESTRAGVLFDGPQIPTSLDQLTIELVLDVEEILPLTGSFAMFIGESDIAPSLFMRLGAGDSTPTQAGEVSLFWDDGVAAVAVGTWTVGMGLRRVLHIVVDSAVGAGSDSVLLYADGIRFNAELSVTQIEPLALTGNEYLVLGNSFNGTRTFSGKLYFAALYDRAFSAEDVRRNAEILRCDDARPATAP